MRDLSPQNIQAEQQYREAWEAYRATYDDEERKGLESRMDRLQPLIADSPKDPRWAAFKNCLTGYDDFWSHMLERTLADRGRMG